jgi:tetratricopeptide (TPR) repeat protein
VVDIRRGKLGADHPDTLEAMNSLAYALDSAKRLDDAAAVYKQILDLRRAKLGNEHAETASSMRAFAEAYLKTGSREESLAVFDQLLKSGAYLNGLALAARLGPDAFNKILGAAVAYSGEKTPQPLDALVLGELRLIAGKADSAEAAIRAAIDRGNATPCFYKSLGWCLLTLGNADEAKQAFQEALKNRRRSDGSYNLENADPDQMAAAYFLDLISEQQFVEHLANDERLACFPWFYVGQRREIEGKPEAAIAAYQQSIDSVKDETAPSVRSLARWRLEKLRQAPANQKK